MDTYELALIPIKEKQIEPSAWPAKNPQDLDGTREAKIEAFSNSWKTPAWGQPVRYSSLKDQIDETFAFPTEIQE